MVCLKTDTVKIWLFFQNNSHFMVVNNYFCLVLLQSPHYPFSAGYK